MSYLIETEGYGYSKRLCRNICEWFIAQYLPKHSLYILITHRSLKKDGAYGYCDVLENTYRPREFLIEIDTHLNSETYTRTLLHELHHVLQFVREELKLKSSKRYYKGECIEDLNYSEQPHEIAARFHERILYNEYMQYTKLK